MPRGVKGSGKAATGKATAARGGVRRTAAGANVVLNPFSTAPYTYPRHWHEAVAQAAMKAGLSKLDAERQAEALSALTEGEAYGRYLAASQDGSFGTLFPSDDDLRDARAEAAAPMLTAFNRLRRIYSEKGYVGSTFPDEAQTEHPDLYADYQRFSARYNTLDALCRERGLVAQ